jgi:protein O-GlcNAc transferase
MSASTETFQTALFHHRGGQLPQAELLYRQVLDAEPGNIDAAFNLAALLNATGQTDAAIDLYRHILSLRPEETDTLSNLGNALQKRGDLDAAEHCYRQAIAIDPGHAAAHTNLGNLLIQAGRGEEAEAVLRQAIDIDPFETAALNSLGALLTQVGRADEGRECFETAISVDPNDPESNKNLGAALATTEQVEQAFVHLSRAVQLAPDWASAHLEMGRALDIANRKEEAADAFRRAAELDPGYTAAWQGLACLLIERRDYKGAGEALASARASQDHDDALTAYYAGNLAIAQGDTETAIREYARAAEIQPDSADILNSYGSCLQQNGRDADARPILERAVELRPNFAEALNNLGNAYVNLRQFDEAIGCYTRALAVQPGLAITACNLGNVYRNLSQLDLAERCFRQAIDADPNLQMAYNGLALTKQMHHRHADAIELFEKALKIDPDYPEALNNLAISFCEIGRYDLAIQAYGRVLDIKPDLPETLFNLGTLLQHETKWDESVSVFAEALKYRPDYNSIYPFLAHSLMQQCNWSNLEGIIRRIRDNVEEELAHNKRASVSPFALQSLPGDFPMALRQKVAEQVCNAIGRDMQEIADSKTFSFNREIGDRKLRIGYVSPDFRAHSVAVAFKGILENHDRDRFETYGYSLYAGHEDYMTEQLIADFHGFTRIAEMSYQDVAEKIHGDGIDILIDLAGHTKGARPGVFAMRAAPIQAHYLGYSATIGAKWLDYLITDHQQVPEDQRQFFTEKLVYLPDTFMATQRAPVAVETPSRAECGIPEDAFVLVNCNAQYKFEPRLFGIWMRILRQVPDAVLVMMETSVGSARNLKLEAKARGVDPDRLIFLHRIPHPQHLARLKHADLALDCLYHGGGVTTVDCLWIGVPMVTVTGKTPQSRNGASLLSPIGLSDLITPDIASYEKLVLDLARDRERLAGIRQRLADNRDSKPLFNPMKLTRHLEQGYRMMWENYAAGNPPQVINVPQLLN